ncbi:hypothetical protein SNE40_004585 [Patella caerulea]|uniref:RanBD1 domain-containing protein n=1 Tax=Patella caerulea TaxID=87958 RepID=A0AAN8K3C9_PATCE
MADIGAADSAIPGEDKKQESKTLPQDDNSPSSSGLPESSDQATNYVIQSASSPSAFTSSDQQPKNGASVLQPSKLAGNFRPGVPSFGGESNIGGSFGTNPFAQNSPSNAETVSEGVIAPSKFSSSPLANRFGSGEAESDDERGFRGFRSVLAPSKLGSKNKEDNRHRFQFRPSVLSSKVDSLTNKECGVASSNSVSPVSSILKPATLPDPRLTTDSSGSDNEAQAKSVSSSDSKTSSVNDNTGSTSVISSTAPDEASKENHFTGLPESRLPNSTSNLGSSDFVFGQNLSNRVTGVSSTNVNDDGGPGFLFGEALGDRVKNGEEEKKDEPDSNETVSSPERNQTLAESAREYQAKQENKPDLKEVEVVTGEEEESNVLQATAKLYLFDGDNQTWIERGQGLCRLNDMTSSEAESFQSRLIMRTQGSLRVILNTPIWCGMTVERASPKSVRITATDGDDGVKIFVIMSNPKDSENLLRAIEWRIQRLKSSEENKPKSTEDQDRGSEKRKADSTDYETVGKKSRQVPVGVAESTREESDSSVQDPETEASCESHSSSLTIRSESSE